MNAITQIQARPSEGDGRRSRLAAYVRDRATEQVLRDALGDLLTAEDTIQRAEPAATRKALQHEPSPGTLILDISGEAHPAGLLDDFAQFVEPGVRVLVIGDTHDLEFYRLITRSLGVLEYLPKPINREIVARLFRPLIVGRGTQETALRTGRIITVTGVRGGVGATTIATNLASHLGETTHRHTLLMDADLHGGTAALMVSAESSDALRTALEHPDRVDDLFLQRATTAVTDRLHVLCSEESLSRVNAIRPESVTELMDLLRRHYNFIVIDVPRAATAFNHAFLDAADQRILVLDSSIASIRDTMRFLAMPQAPQQSRPPILVLNGVGHPATLPRKQVIQKLGRTPEVSIAYLPKALGFAATIGAPAVRGRRGILRSAITSLSQEITTTAPLSTVPPKRPLLERLLGR